jgi:hypothetical protein
MKKIYSLVAGVLLCTLVSAHGTKSPKPTSTSSVAVTHAAGSSLVKLYYKAEKSGTVQVSILNERNEIVFNETLKKIEYFVRPYNFTQLPEGEYTLIVNDESGKSVEKVSYKNEKVEKLIHVVKLIEEDKYMLTVSSAKPQDVFIYIFDENGILVHNEIQSISKDFAQVYNLKDVKSFTIEVWDKDGALQRYANY